MGACPNCGSKNAPDRTTCGACGTPLGTAGADGGPGGPEAIQPPPPTRSPSDVEAARRSATEDGPGGAEENRRPPPDLDLPQVAPPSLPQRPPARSSSGRKRRGSGMRSVVPIAVALILVVLFEQMISSAIAPDAYIYRLFRPQGGWLMGVVPALILFVFVWTITDLLMKWGVTRKNERDLERPDIKQLPVVVGGEPPAATLDRLRGLERDFVARPVGQRVVWVLRHLVTDQDLQRTHELLRHHSDLDADGAASGYRTATLFIWAMPILGFIGTVLGISLAVGGFSDFLTTSVSIDEIDRVTQELGNVASGLSFAFDTTLLGLLAGLVASVISSGVQKREERFLTGLDELGLQIMANSTVNQGQQPAAATTTADGGEAARQVLVQLDQMSQRLDAFTHSMRTGLDGLDQASSRMSTGLATSIGQVNQAVEQLGTSLEGASSSLTGNIRALSQKLSASEERLEEGLASLREGMARSGERDAAGQEAMQRLTASIGDLGARDAAGQEAMQRLTASIGELGARIAEFKRAQDSLSPALNRLAGPLELRLAPAQSPPGDSHGAAHDGGSRT